jgi:adenylate cyclase class IV
MENMKEFKIKYPHYKAKEIFKDIGATFKEKTEQEDFYLKSTDETILRLKKEGGKIYLINFTKEKDGFGINLSERLDKEATDSLLSFFKGNPLIIKKIREHYIWKGAEIVLDNVVGLGEFIELYPREETSKEELLKIFNINPAELITESYYDMWKK